MDAQTQHDAVRTALKGMRDLHGTQGKPQRTTVAFNDGVLELVRDVVGNPETREVLGAALQAATSQDVEVPENVSDWVRVAVSDLLVRTRRELLRQAYSASADAIGAIDPDWATDAAFAAMPASSPPARPIDRLVDHLAGVAYAATAQVAEDGPQADWLFDIADEAFSTAVQIDGAAQ